MSKIKDSGKIILAAVESLSEVSRQELDMGLRTGTSLPSIEELKKLMEKIRSVLFPGFFDRSQVTERSRFFRIGVDVENIYTIVKQQIASGLVFCCEKKEEMVIEKARKIAFDFVASLPEIRRKLLTDVEAVTKNDPAVTSCGEVVFSYPVIQVMIHYRTANQLLKLGAPIIPRIITEMAHSATGIDIHPAAEIGEYFSIDHGTGVVIGATSIIGDNVTLYQGVTLGAKNFRYDENGKPLDIPRHPILENNVTVYSNTSILGRVRIGHDTIIGGNVWLTHDVPPHSRILQGKAVYMNEFEEGAGI